MTKLAGMGGKVALLAAPFVVASLWLGLGISALGMSDMAQGVVFGIVLAIAVVLLAMSLGWLGVVLGAVLYLASFVLCAGDAISWFMQGSSFNERFFANVDVHNFQASLDAYPGAVWGVLIGLVVVIGLVLVLTISCTRGRRKYWLLVPAILLLIVGAVVDAPPRRLYAYFLHAEASSNLAHGSEANRILAMLDSNPTRPDEVVAKPGRNLIFIYMESLERTYTDRKRFPGLTPNIDRLKRDGLDFSGFETFPGVTYTIAGVFSSQCGAPYLINTVFGDDFGKLGFVPNNDNTTKASFHPELACLGDVLHTAGYDQTYMEGVALNFANTGEFFRLHQYDHVLGKRDIEKLHGDKLKTEGWGLFDSDVFAQALSTYKAKEKLGKPFSIVLSTIDTHPPKGYVLPDCTHYKAIQNAMLDAVHCADQLLGRFIKKLVALPGWSNTVVVVMSDHVAMRNVASPLYPPDNRRQPLLFVVNAGHGDRSARMYHMDIAPTILSLLGVHSNVRFMAGSDRSAPTAKSNPLPATRVAKIVLRRQLWKRRRGPAVCKRGVLIKWNGQGGFDVGGEHLPMMLGGYPVKRLADTDSLLIFVNKQRAQLQIVSMGQQTRWIQKARASGGSVFEATPAWDSSGRRYLALDWLAPNGAWASLGGVEKMRDIDLHSPECKLLLAKISSAAPGARLDFSPHFGTKEVTADSELRPGFVVSPKLPHKPSAAEMGAFMFGRLVKQHAGYSSVHINAKKRIAIMPGHHNNAFADFDVSGLRSIELMPRVDNLFGSCMRRKDTGIVGVKLWLDGHLLGPRFMVDRNYRKNLEVPLDGARRFRIEVDEGNGIPDCDYFALGFGKISFIREATAR